MAKKEKEVKEKIKHPMDKKKLIQNVVIIILVVAMILSVAASLIYSLINL